MATSTTPQPSKGAVIFEDILNDALLGLAAAASIFVKNPQHQQVAGSAVSLLAQLVATIDNQINAATTQQAPPAPTPLPTSTT